MENMENFQKINGDVKKLLEDIEEVKASIDLFSVLVEKKVKLVSA